MYKNTDSSEITIRGAIANAYIKEPKETNIHYCKHFDIVRGYRLNTCPLYSNCDYKDDKWAQCRCVDVLLNCLGYNFGECEFYIED